MVGAGEAMKATVILPTYNRAESLDRCLSALTRQSLKAGEFEVIVVVNGSTDQTLHVVKRYATALNLSVASLPEPGLHAARHEGMRRAAADVLLFADDDTEAGTGWVDSVVRTFEDPRVLIVGGNNYPAFQEPPPRWLTQLWETPVYKGRALPQLSILDFGEGAFAVDPVYVWGCNFSIRKSALIAAGGFHPDGFPESRLRFRGDGETHVSREIRRKGGLTVFTSEASVRHSVPPARMTPEYFRKRSWAQGISDSYTAIRSGRDHGFSPAAMLRKLIGKFRIRLDRRGASDPDLRSILAANHAAYWSGYMFHQREVRMDPLLKAWVLQDRYL